MIDFCGTRRAVASQEVETLLNKQSGLLGISGLTNDMRELLDEEREYEDRRARLAIESSATACASTSAPTSRR